MNDLILDHLLEAEGWPTFTDHPADRGGPTKGGITLATLQASRGTKATVADLRDLREPEARKIYERSYIDAPGFNGIEDVLLRWQVVDGGVLSGPARSALWLQMAAGAPADGILGPVSLKKINEADPHILALRYCAIRARTLAKIVSLDHSQAVWAAGWMNRCMSFLDREAGRTKEA